MVNRASHSNHLALGQVCLSKGLHDEALEALETAIALNPNDADGYAFLARALSFAGRPDEAIELIGKAQRLNPAAPRWYAWNLGWRSISRGATRTPSPPSAKAGRSATWVTDGSQRPMASWVASRTRKRPPRST